MCRIFGCFGVNYNSNIPSFLSRASFLQLAGGPDQQGMKYGESWGIGVNRLAIQGLYKTVDGASPISNNLVGGMERNDRVLTGGAQPYEFQNNVFVVFNGEIYNHRELRRGLRAKGYNFQDECDGSIIPALYIEHGEDFVRKLEGMFSIAIVDLRGQPKLILITDHLGIKPLYFHWNEAGKNLSFSSEIAGVFAFPGVDFAVRDEAVDEYLSTRVPFGDGTIYEGIKSLEPGKVLSLTKGCSPKMTEYVPDSVLIKHECGEQSGGEYLLGLLDSEVRRILDADVPISLITSGGVDSSILVALAKKHRHELEAFHVCTKGQWSSDERRFAKEVTKYCGVNYHEVEVDPKNFPDIISAFSKSLGQPDTAPQSLGAFELARAISENGYKVAIGGEGADELFGGYDRFRMALTDDDLSWKEKYFSRLAPFDQVIKTSLYTDDFENHLRNCESPYQKFNAQIGSDFNCASHADRLKSILLFEQAKRLPAHLLRRADHLMMANSIEMRVPFCQPRIVGFSRAVNSSEDIALGLEKPFVYAAARGVVPQSILGRKKQHFILPIAEIYARNSRLRQFMTDILSSVSFVNSPYFNASKVSNLLDKDHRDMANDDVLALWSLLIYELTTQHIKQTTQEKGQSVSGVDLSK